MSCHHKFSIQNTNSTKKQQQKPVAYNTRNQRSKRHAEGITCPKQYIFEST